LNLEQPRLVSLFLLKVLLHLLLHPMVLTIPQPEERCRSPDWYLLYPP
jgi:hypothetical protein